MARPKRLIGLLALEKARSLLNLGVPITTIHTQLGLDEHMHYKTTYVILKADSQGHTHATRPEWLQDEPLIQVAPDGWQAIGEFPDTEWRYYDTDN